MERTVESYIPKKYKGKITELQVGVRFDGGKARRRYTCKADGNSIYSETINGLLNRIKCAMQDRTAN